MHATVIRTVQTNIKAEHVRRRKHGMQMQMQMGMNTEMKMDTSMDMNMCTHITGRSQQNASLRIALHTKRPLQTARFGSREARSRCT